jgi:hypothetical protein
VEIKTSGYKAGCGISAIASVTGKDCKEVLSLVDSLYPKRDWNVQGMLDTEIKGVLQTLLPTYSINYFPKIPGIQWYGLKKPLFVGEIQKKFGKVIENGTGIIILASNVSGHGAAYHKSLVFDPNTTIPLPFYYWISEIYRNKDFLELNTFFLITAEPIVDPMNEVFNSSRKSIIWDIREFKSVSHLVLQSLWRY